MLWAIFLLFRDIQRGEEILYDYGVNVLFEKVIVTFCAIENIWFGIMRLTIWVSKPYIPPQFSFTPMHNLFIWFSLQQPLNDLKLGNVVSNNRPQSKLEFGRFVICHSRVMSLSEFFFFGQKHLKDSTKWRKLGNVVEIKFKFDWFTICCSIVNMPLNKC